jgi:predicted nuclease of predicted toxin-antitoxin system
VKFIVDAQLPKSLSDFLCSKGYDSIHTLDLPEKNKTVDDYINGLSIKENRVVISKDADFLESFLLKKIPPKLLLVKTGNITNASLLQIFEQHLTYITDSLLANSLIEITKTEIIIHQ